MIMETLVECDDVTSFIAGLSWHHGDTAIIYGSIETLTGVFKASWGY
jgi:hypothetical protein